MAEKSIYADGETLKKLNKFRVKKNDEFVVKAVMVGPDMLLSTVMRNGSAPLHPPYVIRKDGNIEYTDMDDRTIQEAFKSGNVVYYNPYLLRY